MSVSWGTQYAKLKTNLRLAANRLKLLQKKKTEQAVKARTEIAEFLSSDKEDRARIRVETIIREDFVVEAYELLETYCELLLARFGIIQQMKDLDDGIAEAVSSLLWVAPRISHEISELKVISDELTHKYGKQFAEAARMNQLPEPSRVSPKLVHKLSIGAPSKLLVEKYLITIAQSAGIDFTPDQKVMRDDDDEIARAEKNLINFMNEEQYGWTVKSDDVNNKGGGGSGGTGSMYGGGGGSTMGSEMAHPVPPIGQYPSVGVGFPPPDYAAPPPPPSYPHGNMNVPAPNAMPPYPAAQNYGTATGHPTEHIYETPPSVHPHQPEKDEDFLLPKFPEPPKDVPTPYFPGNGANRPPTDNNKPPTMGGNDDLDFDALAKQIGRAHV